MLAQNHDKIQTTLVERLAAIYRLLSSKFDEVPNFIAFEGVGGRENDTNTNTHASCVQHFFYRSDKIGKIFSCSHAMKGCLFVYGSYFLQGGMGTKKKHVKIMTKEHLCCHIHLLNGKKAGCYFA